MKLSIQSRYAPPHTGLSVERRYTAVSREQWLIEVSASFDVCQQMNRNGSASAINATFFIEALGAWIVHQLIALQLQLQTQRSPCQATAAWGTSKGNFMRRFRSSISTQAVTS